MKIVCGCFGTIYLTKILKDGKMSANNRRDVTDECVNAVRDHLMTKMETDKVGCAGYVFTEKSNGRKLEMCLYDTSKYKLVEIEK